MTINWNAITKSFVLLIIGTTLSIFLGMRGLNGSSDPLPIGSDEFGYLHMAESIRSGRLFGEHTERPYLLPLQKYLIEQGVSLDQNTTSIGPLAYHLKDNHLINQYPPGTSLLLSFLPKEVVKQSFGAIVLVLTFLIVGTALKLVGLSILESLGGSLLLVSMMSVLPPWSQEFIRVNSLAPTFSLIIAAGILASSRPLLAAAFLSAATLFRVANVVVLAAFVSWYLFSFRDKPKFLNQAAKLFVVILISGLGFYLMYVWRLLGSPFAPTYAAIDTTFTDLSKIPRYIGYYFNPNKPWFLAHVLLIPFQVPFSLGIFVTCSNYLFFITHKVRLAYYPYASANFLLGLVVSNIISHKKIRPFLRSGWVIASLIVGFTGIPDLPSSSRYQEAAADYQNLYSQADVVWAELESGRIEYATGIPVLRYPAAATEIRRLIISWLAKNNYRQAFVVSDRGISVEAVETDLNSTSISWSSQKSKIGEILVTRE